LTPPDVPWRLNFVITWAWAGVRLERISDCLGHADIRMTRIYARFMRADEYDPPFIDRARPAVR
jgi:hypothetical protein